jgi:hypothetical protein
MIVGFVFGFLFALLGILNILKNSKMHIGKNNIIEKDLDI